MALHTTARQLRITNYAFLIAKGLRLGDATRLQASGANLHVAGRTVGGADVHIHEIGLETALGDTGGVKTDAALRLRETVTNNTVANHRLLAANFANTRHDNSP